jgi:hypothetical protein
MRTNERHERWKEWYEASCYIWNNYKINIPKFERSSSYKRLQAKTRQAIAEAFMDMEIERTKPNV